MKYDIVKTDDYLLVIDDSEIKEGDFYLRYNDSVLRCTQLKESFNEGLNKNEIIILANGCGDPYERSRDYLKKIIAHLPLNNSPILDGVDLLPTLEQDDDVEKMAIVHATNPDMMTYVFPDKKESFIKGYNKAKEKYKITLEKMIDLYIEETGYGMDMWSKEENNVMIIIAKIIQSLSQPKYPIDFECEMEQLNNKPGSSYGMITRYKPKTTTNSQGQTILVGKYIY
jgi:hypothetical protein